MQDITTEMLDIIAKNLPATTAGAMSDFIAEADKTKEALAKAEEKIEQLGEDREIKLAELKKVEAQLKDQNKILDLEVALKEEELILERRERNIELTLLQITLKASISSNQTLERLVDKVFGHPSVTVSTTKDVVSPVEGIGGGAGYTIKDFGLMETTTTTEGKI